MTNKISNFIQEPVKCKSNFQLLSTPSKQEVLGSLAPLHAHLLIGFHTASHKKKTHLFHNSGSLGHQTDMALESFLFGLVSGVLVAFAGFMYAIYKMFFRKPNQPMRTPTHTFSLSKRRGSVIRSRPIEVEDIAGEGEMHNETTEWLNNLTQRLFLEIVRTPAVTEELLSQLTNKFNAFDKPNLIV